MANRHANKNLRRRVRERMSATGESYQRALETIRGGVATTPPKRAESLAEPTADALAVASVDLVEASYFGSTITLAVFEMAAPLGRPVIVQLPSSRAWQPGVPMPTPLSFQRRGGWQ